ncbi:unnamed protein product [Owenia fusiformis]|uniref:Uncharacterized protein n=1 Tax=Owenia fusiformis TaxID=6347 RepID=A0A8S4PE56_OWEFU|nr:unnamed protein product [Owenia fusiformis]
MANEGSTDGVSSLLKTFMKARVKNVAEESKLQDFVTTLEKERIFNQIITNNYIFEIKKELYRLEKEATNSSKIELNPDRTKRKSDGNIYDTDNNDKNQQYNSTLQAIREDTESPMKKSEQDNTRELPNIDQAVNPTGDLVRSQTYTEGFHESKDNERQTKSEQSKKRLSRGFSFLKTKTKQIGTMGRAGLFGKNKSINLEPAKTAAAELKALNMKFQRNTYASFDRKQLGEDDAYAKSDLSRLPKLVDILPFPLNDPYKDEKYRRKKGPQDKPAIFVGLDMGESSENLAITDYWVGDPRAVGSIRRDRKSATEMAVQSKAFGELRRAQKDLIGEPLCSRNCNRKGTIHDSDMNNTVTIVLPKISKPFKPRHKAISVDVLAIVEDTCDTTDVAIEEHSALAQQVSLPGIDMSTFNPSKVTPADPEKVEKDLEQTRITRTKKIKKLNDNYEKAKNTTLFSKESTAIVDVNKDTRIRVGYSYKGDSNAIRKSKLTQSMPSLNVAA